MTDAEKIQASKQDRSDLRELMVGWQVEVKFSLIIIVTLIGSYFVLMSMKVASIPMDEVQRTFLALARVTVFSIFSWMMTWIQVIKQRRSALLPDPKSQNDRNLMTWGILLLCCCLALG